MAKDEKTAAYTSRIEELSQAYGKSVEIGNIAHKSSNHCDPGLWRNKQGQGVYQ